ncbi:hypothetical protein GCM10011519_00650 [Marmoricola endophyticus]|uniref:Uncharacterized protein n=1 Tax=Marmoricola endophyticus TaxID=2040280 RepID=A0A917B9S7_9ACTN|nr:hypothetical protein [Marmoricola endophyticus]GGF31095.1 hypothetical protein GCM10011519_00650 [Marmoricola endophyticus]
MGLMDRLRRRGGSGAAVSGGTAVDDDHLTRWSGERRGVEGFVEPQTTTSPVTLLLVAVDGEWTRRRVPSVRWAHDFCNRLGIPSYDAAVVGVPDRMREWNRAQSAKKRGNNFY